MKTMKRSALLVVWLGTSLCAEAQGAPRIPLQETVENSARYRWENKPVLESRLLDDAESPASWQHDDFGEMSFSRERFKDGVQSLRLHSRTKGDQATKDKRPWGYASAVRTVPGEDWSRWNRVALWVYPDLPGHKTVSIYLDVHNGGDAKGKGGTRTRDNVILKNQAWNHVVSEIEHFPRTNVTGVAIRARLHGNEPGTSDTMTYYIDHLELQRVEPDYYHGWSVAPGKISFSHTGYPAGGPKSAIASDLPAREFKLVSALTGRAILVKAIQEVDCAGMGHFQVLEFSEVREPGTYYLEAGGRKSRSFRIDDSVWSEPLTKAVNFFYAERCGISIPGVHDLCHADWVAYKDDLQVPLNGGWHDAGDLSQGIYNTAESTRCMFELAERMRAKGQNAELADRLIEEARWGLDWLLKTATIEGYRPMWLVNGWWSNNKVGDGDDNRAHVTTGAYGSLEAAAAEAVAFRVLKQAAPALAAASLKRAEKDWRDALQRLDKDLGREPSCQSASAAIIAGLELFRASGDRQYADRALELAPRIVDSQARDYLPGARKISGFLYGGPTGKSILHSVTPGARELAQIEALIKLCDTFPESPHWMQWYSGVVLYSEYFYQRVAKTFEPYGLMPGGIYQSDEWKRTWESNQPKMQKMLQGGRVVADGYVVRAFPPSATGFGTTHVNLTQATGLALAAHARGDLGCARLAERQIEWTLGRNPFSQSLMYGEGYDYVPQYTPMGGNMVGALPVGLGARDEDEPYWPAGNNEPSRREQWVQTVARFINLAGLLNGPARVDGQSRSVVTFTDRATGAVTNVIPDGAGRLRAFLPEGNYVVKGDGFERHMALLPGGSHIYDPALDFTVSGTATGQKDVEVRVVARGTGTHKFRLRTENLVLAEPEKGVVLEPGGAATLAWNCQVESAARPWFVVVVPDGDLSQHKELFDPPGIK
jgi:hypothetical protein